MCDPCAHECDDHDHEEREGRYGKRLPDDVAEFHTQTKVAKNDEWSQIIRNFVPPRIHLRGDRKMLETCYQYERIEAGCDEAGRGCLAGAVFAAAVILPPDFHDPLLNDSKQMSERNRDRLRPIIEREAVAWAVAAVPPERIDEINILNASFEGMCRAVGELRTRPEFLAIDGNRFRSSLDIPLSVHRQGRRQVRRHRGGVGAGQDAPRRVYAAVGRRVSSVRLGEEQGLPYARTPSRRESLRGDALSPADVQSRIGAAGTFLIGSAGDVRLPYFIVFRGIGQTDDRRGNADAVVSPACAAWPLLQEGRSRTAAVAEKGTGSIAEGQVCAHGPSSGAVGHGVPPAYGRSVSRSNLDGIRAAPVGTARVLPNDGADVIAAYKNDPMQAASDRFRIGSGI